MNTIPRIVNPPFGPLTMLAPTAGTGLRTLDRLSYCGPFIYHDGRLEQVLFDGGYISVDTVGTPRYHYYQRDHLGSVRVVVNEAGALENTNSYSAFGSVTNANAAYALNRYKYNGKEMERTHGIDCLDYGARWYEPVIGRFTTMDPLSEKYYHISPYAYCGNNPVNAIDEDGNVITYLNQHTGQQYIYLRGDFYNIIPDAKGHFQKVTVKNSNDNFAYRLLMSLRKMDNSSNSLVRKVFSSISQSATSNHKIQQDKSSEVEPYDGTSSNVFLDFSLKGRQKDDFDGIGLTDYEIVGHELKHSYDIQFQK